MDWKLRLGLAGGVAVLLLVAIFFFNEPTGNVVAEDRMGAFMDCLNDKEVVLYGFTNNPSVDAQLGLFGVYVLNLNVIDCHAEPEKCEGVIVYPSWRIDDRIISSGLSLGVLSDLSGCRF